MARYRPFPQDEPASRLFVVPPEAEDFGQAVDLAVAAPLQTMVSVEPGLTVEMFEFVAPARREESLREENARWAGMVEDARAWLLAYQTVWAAWQDERQEIARRTDTFIDEVWTGEEMTSQLTRNGAFLDRGAMLLAEMKKFLREWERVVRAASREVPSVYLSDREVDALRFGGEVTVTVDGGEIKLTVDDFSKEDLRALLDEERTVRVSAATGMVDVTIGQDEDADRDEE